MNKDIPQIIGKVHIPITNKHIRSIKYKDDSKWIFNVKDHIGNILGQVTVELDIKDDQYEQLERLIDERSFEDFH
jgi:hypothetical protein